MILLGLNLELKAICLNVKCAKDGIQKIQQKYQIKWDLSWIIKQGLNKKFQLKNLFLKKDIFYTTTIVNKSRLGFCFIYIAFLVYLIYDKYGLR